jgi:zinc finger SWIM domain-containing protein 3
MKVGMLFAFNKQHTKKLNNGHQFSTLVGVNNHNKTTIFGVALLYDETAESFVCPFKTFLATMLGKKPHIILTRAVSIISRAQDSKGAAI